MAIADLSEVTDVPVSRNPDGTANGGYLTTKQLALRGVTDFSCFWCDRDLLTVDGKIWYWHLRKPLMMHCECLVDFHLRIGPDALAAARARQADER